VKITRAVFELVFTQWYNLIVAIKTVTTNRKAYHNYHIEDGVEAGIMLAAKCMILFLTFPSGTVKEYRQKFPTVQRMECEQPQG